MRAAFCVRESLSAGRRKSDAPARTTPHFITGALFVKTISIIVLNVSALKLVFSN